MSARNGKIARLPAALRHELNERLDDGQDGPELLDWLNARPEVQALVRDKFGGTPISPQNLSQWRQGGFQDWLLRQELFGEIQALAETADDVAGETPNGAAIIDHAATVLAVRFGSLLLRWNGEVDEAIEAKARLLNGLCRSVVRLQRSVHDSNQARLEEQRQREQEQDRQREKTRKKVLGPIDAKLNSPFLAQTLGGGEKGLKIAEAYLNILSHDFESPLHLWPDKNHNPFTNNDIQFTPPPQTAPSESQPIKANQSDSVASPPVDNPVP